MRTPDRGVAVRESQLVDRVLLYLNSRPDCLVRKLHGDRYSVAGDPDVYGVLGGRHLCLEVKAPGGSLSPLQWLRLRQWRRAGALVAVVSIVAPGGASALPK